MSRSSAAVVRNYTTTSIRKEASDGKELNSTMKISMNNMLSISTTKSLSSATPPDWILISGRSTQEKTRKSTQGCSRRRETEDQ
jgi:hypothetical protein